VFLSGVQEGELMAVRLRVCLLAFLLGNLPTLLSAAAPIVPAAWRESFIPNGFVAGELVPFTLSPQAAPSLRITTARATDNPWDRRLLALGNVRVAAGDTGLLRVRIRTVNMNGRPGFAKFVIQSANQPYRKSVEWSLKIDSEWRQFEIPFHFAEAYPSSLYTAEFWLPLAQSIEMTGLTLEHYGAASFATLGLADFPYAGAADTAAWRVAARQRIEEIRKGPVTVVVRDAQGKPVAGAPVRLKMKRHAFAFGSAVSADTLRDGSNNGELYRAQVAKLFNAAVLENDLKWPEWEADRTRALLGLAWLKSNGIEQVRGHNVIWPDWSRMPNDVSGKRADAAGMRTRVNSHIEEVVASVRGLVSEWDVVNEPVSVNVLEPVLGPAEMPRWFQQVRGLDPAVRLYANEYGVVDDGGENLLQQDRYAALLDSLLAAGAAIDGIGLQAHIGDHLTSPEQFLAILDRFSAFGKDLKITEFDVAGETEAIQASYTRDFLTAAFSHPRMSGVYLWGFWAGRHYRPEAALYRLDWTRRPAADVWDDLVFHQWWSDVSGTTDAHGAFTARVFYGDYDVEASVGGARTTQTWSYSPGAANSTVSFGAFDVGPLWSSAVRNAASLAPGPVAANEQVLIRTRDFGPEPAVEPPNGTAPTALAGRQVFVNGTPVRILATTPDSILCLLPSGLGPMATVQLSLFGKLTNSIALPVAEAAPGLFVADRATGRAAAANDDGLPLMAAKKETYVTVRATGIDRASALTVLLDGAPAADVSIAPLGSGLSAIRFLIPGATAPGTATLQVISAERATQLGVTLEIN
jgi:endo-1,4-beta-xylanase